MLVVYGVSVYVAVMGRKVDPLKQVDNVTLELHYTVALQVHNIWMHQHNCMAVFSAGVHIMAFAVEKMILPYLAIPATLVY